MQCSHCGKQFRQNELAPPSTILAIFSLPLFIGAVFKSRNLRGEFTSLYCKPCRRAINVCLFFVAFMVVLIGGMMIAQKFGLIETAPIKRKAAMKAAEHGLP